MIHWPQMATAPIQNLIVIITRLWRRLPVSTGLLKVDRLLGAVVLIAPAFLEALNALNSQNVDYIKYINSAGLHALNTLIQPAGIH